MRITCDRCKSRAIITSCRELSPVYRQLYCCCKNAECGHSFVVDLTFSHTLSPSALDLPEQLRERLRQGGNRGQICSLFKGCGGRRHE